MEYVIFLQDYATGGSIRDYIYKVCIISLDQTIVIRINC